MLRAMHSHCAEQTLTDGYASIWRSNVKFEELSAPEGDIAKQSYIAPSFVCLPNAQRVIPRGVNIGVASGYPCKVGQWLTSSQHVAIGDERPASLDQRCLGIPTIRSGALLRTRSGFVLRCYDSLSQLDKHSPASPNRDYTRH
jgi:hypothetical protein